MGSPDISECISFLGDCSMFLFCIRMIPNFAEAWLCILPSFCFQINFWNFIIEDWSSWQYQIYCGYAFSLFKKAIFLDGRDTGSILRHINAEEIGELWRLSCHKQITKNPKFLNTLSHLPYSISPWRQHSAFSINLFYSSRKFKKFHSKCLHLIFLENIVGTCRLGRLPRN